MHVWMRSLVALVVGACLAGCATGFPRAGAPYAAADGLDGAAVLARGVAAALAEARGCRAATLVYTGQLPTLRRESHFFAPWFTGWADDPNVAVCAFVEDAEIPATDIAGGAVAAPIVKAVIEALR